MTKEDCRKLMAEHCAGTYRAKELAEGKEPHFSFPEIVTLMQKAFAAGEEA